MANTEQIEAKLCAYVDGDLDAAARAEIEQHLAANPQHRQLLAELIEQRDLLRQLPREKAPDDLFDSFQTQLERSVLLDTNRVPTGGINRNRMSQWVAVAAVFLLAIGLAAVIFFVLPDKSKTQTNYAVYAPTTLPAAAMDGSAPMRSAEAKAGPASAPAPAPEMKFASSVAGDTEKAADHARDVVRDMAKNDTKITLAEPAAPLAVMPPVESKAEGDKSPAVATLSPAPEKAMKVSAATDAIALQSDIADRVRQLPQVPSHSMVVVVNTPDPTATNHQVTSYLAMNKLRWDDVPADRLATVAGGAAAVTTQQAIQGKSAGIAHAEQDALQQIATRKAASEVAESSKDSPAATLSVAPRRGAASQPSAEIAKDAVAQRTSPIVSTQAANEIQSVASTRRLEDNRLAMVQNLQTQQSQAGILPSRYIVARGLTQSQLAELNQSIAGQNSASILNYRRVNDTITQTPLTLAVADQKSASTTQPAGQITFDTSRAIGNGAVGGGAINGVPAAGSKLDAATTTAPATQLASTPTTKPAGSAMAAGATGTAGPTTAPALAAIVATTQPTFTPSEIAKGALASMPATAPSFGAAMATTGPTSQPITLAKSLPTPIPAHVPSTNPTSAPAEEKVDVVIVVQSAPNGPTAGQNVNQAIDQAVPTNTGPVVAASAPATAQAAPSTAPATTQPQSAPLPAPILKARRP